MVPSLPTSDCWWFTEVEMPIFTGLGVLTCSRGTSGHVPCVLRKKTSLGVEWEKEQAYL